MEYKEKIERQYRMLAHMSNLPKKMLIHHGKDNITEFVLYELCHEHCFNFNRAAYFIDNQDFNCTKGIAGFSRDEVYSHPEIWENPSQFSEHMKSSAFNKKVRSINRTSLKKIADSHEQLAQEIAKDLGFKNFGYCTWPVKHENDGFLVYEKVSALDTYADDYLINGLSLLAFCPVF